GGAAAGAWRRPDGPVDPRGRAAADRRCRLFAPRAAPEPDAAARGAVGAGRCDGLCPDLHRAAAADAAAPRHPPGPLSLPRGRAMFLTTFLTARYGRCFPSRAAIESH